MLALGGMLGSQMLTGLFVLLGLLVVEFLRISHSPVLVVFWLVGAMASLDVSLLF